MKPHIPTLSAADRASYIDSAAKAFDRGAAKLNSTYNSTPNQGMERAGLSVIREAVDRERRQLVAKLNLSTMVTMTTPSTPTITINTSGDNSPVNVGSGSLTQSVSSTTVSMVDLSKALGDLLVAIDNHGGSPELREVVAEAKVEAEKPKPNPLRLKGLLGGAKDVVQTVGGLKGAWEAIEVMIGLI